MATATVRSHSTSIRDNPAYQAYLVLRTGFVVAPILFGLDKFTNLLTDWTTYLAPAVDRLVPGDATSAMLAVGVVAADGGPPLGHMPVEGAADGVAQAGQAAELLIDVRRVHTSILKQKILDSYPPARL